MSTAHVMALLSVLPAFGMIGVLLGSFLPLGCGLWILSSCEAPSQAGVGRLGRILLLAWAGMCLSPFLVWWRLAPTRVYFAANVAAHYVVMVSLLAALNRLAGASARQLGDTMLRRESRAGLVMVLWLSSCTVGALAWLYHRNGVLGAGLPTVLIHLARLPSEAHMLFLLPYAMTAYVMWRAKETGFRYAVNPPP